MLDHHQVPVRNGTLHVVEGGASKKSTIVFLHGWPECWRSFETIMSLASERFHAVAMDLPGIGASTMKNAPRTKRDIADCIHEFVAQEKLQHVTIVGHDVGGQIAYSYLQRYAKELDGAVIMNVVVPGIKPWEDVIRNPYIWHFALHAIPGLPELLVTGKERAYFDYFYQAITAHPDRITADARVSYVEAYSAPDALSVGFNWYRAFGQDVKDNLEHSSAGIPNETALLYLRGDH